jgi:hypothetical protein
LCRILSFVLYCQTMKPWIVLLFLTPRSLFAIVNMIVGVESPCTSIIDCLSSTNSHAVCYESSCVPCRQSNESCSSSMHCCSGSRCYRHRCTPLYITGQACRLHRQCLDVNDFCVNRTCTRCVPLWSTCSSDPLTTPCCIGLGICRHGICQPAHTDSQACISTFDCANELICLAGKCQNPLGQC